MRTFLHPRQFPHFLPYKGRKQVFTLWTWEWALLEEFIKIFSWVIILTNKRKEKIWFFWYWPSWVGLQQRSFCPVLLLSVEGDWVQVRSKGKLYSLIREWRGESSGARVHALPEKQKSPARLLYRVVGSREGAGFSQGGCRCAAQDSRSHTVPGAASLLTAHHRHLELSVMHSAHSPPGWRVWQHFGARNSSVKTE